MTTVFIISPSAPHRVIREAECKLIQRKWTWAEDQNGARHLLGSTAFYTLASARRAKLGALRKVHENNYIKYFKPPVWAAANEELMRNPSHDFKVVPLKRA